MERSLFLAFDPGGALAGSVATLLSLPPAAVDEWLDEWGRPPATSTLLGLGPDTGAVSREIARLPIFLAAAEHEVPISLGWELADYTVSVEIHTTAGPLTHVSLFILTVVHSEFIRAGSPSDGELPVTLAGVCRLLGRSAHGGWQIDDARRELRRLAGAEIVLRVRVRGQRPREERLRFFGYREEPGATNEVVLTLDPTIARHLRVGRSTYLDLSVYSALLSADPVASRIWAYWETLPWRPPGRRSFPLWPAPPGEAPPQMTWNLPLAAVAGLHGANRSWVRARIGRALLSVVALDPAYRDALIGPLSRGMATASLVRVARVRRPEPGEAGLVAAAPGVWSHRSITRGAIARGVWSHRAGGVEPSRGGCGAIDPNRASEALPSRLPSRPSYSVHLREDSPSARALLNRAQLLNPGRPDLARLESTWGHPVSDAQRARLWEIVDRHAERDDPLAGPWWAALIMDAAIARGQDPLEALFAEDRAWQAPRREAAARDEAGTGHRRARTSEGIQPLTEIIGPGRLPWDRARENMIRVSPSPVAKEDE